MRFWTFVISVLAIVSFSSSAFAKDLNGFDISNLSVNADVLARGGPARDEIPAIFSPDYQPGAQAEFVREEDLVLGINLNGKTFAYPLYILNWHEIVNDEQDGQGFIIVYCPLCGSGVAFASKAGKRNLSFGVSGLLYNSDLVLYDKETESLWTQIDGKAIAGPLVGSGLEQLPLQVTTWRAWLAANPKTLVLSESQGFTRNYRHQPFSGYEESEQLFFEVLRQAPKKFHTKEPVMGIEINGEYKAYPFIELRNHGQERFVDNFAGQSINIHWSAKDNSAHATDSNGNDLVTTKAYWFAWYNFYPDTEVFVPRQ
ncbi:MAG: DUF3179 domain-containing protein [Burkholderiaceae bacterium]